MKRIVIKGGKRLEGEIIVSGSKNASLPILAACILNKNKITLYNVPKIEDVSTTFEILKSLGAKVQRNNNKVIVNCRNINSTTIPDELMRKLRSSVIIAGAIIGRKGKVSFTYPGGCDIGSRPIDLHLSSFKKLGIKISENSRYIECRCDKINTNEINLDFPSVGATENIILASVIGNHEVIINNAAIEPEIEDLIMFLNKMGANVKWIGVNSIKIIGVEKLKETTYRIMPDRIEAGTYLAIAAITNGNIRVNNLNLSHIISVVNKMEEMGYEFIKDKTFVEIKSIKKRPESVNIITYPYPGFPTDMQPIISVLQMVSKGNSIITENIFENRFKYANELKRMGAKIEIKGNNLFIKGIKRFHGNIVTATDLRGGMAMVLAGLNARGKTRINNIEYILRGYEELDKKLQVIGANIEIKEGE